MPVTPLPPGTASTGYYISDEDRFTGTAAQFAGALFDVDVPDAAGGFVSRAVEESVLRNLLGVNRGPNLRPGGPFYLTYYDAASPNYTPTAGLTLVGIPAALRCIGCTATAEFGPDGYRREYVTVYDPASPVFVFKSGDFAAGTQTNAAKWVLKDSLEAARANVPAITADPASVPVGSTGTYTLNGTEGFYQRKAAPAGTAYAVPTGPDDANWRQVAPPQPARGSADTLQGEWNPRTNTPPLTAGVGTKGDYFTVNTAGVLVLATVTAATTNAQVALGSAAGVASGQTVTGGGLAAGITVSSVAGNVATLSAAVAVASGAVLTFTQSQTSGVATSASTAVTVGSVAGIGVGNTLTSATAGTTIPAGTTVTAVNAATLTLTLSAAATIAASSALTFTQTATTSAATANTLVNVNATTNAAAGQLVTGPGIPAGTTVTGFTATTLTLSTPVAVAANALLQLDTYQLGLRGFAVGQELFFTGTAWVLRALDATAPLLARFAMRGAYAAGNYQQWDAVSYNGATYYRNAAGPYAAPAAFDYAAWVGYGAGLYTTIDYANEITPAANALLNGVGGKSYVLNGITVQPFDVTGQPAGAPFYGRLFAFRAVGTAASTVAPLGGTIDGATSVVLQPGEWLVLKSDFAAGGYTKVMRGTVNPPGTDPAATLAYAASVALDFMGPGALITLALTGNVAFTTANRAVGRTLSVRLQADATARTLSFPAGWVFLGSAAPTGLAAGKTAILSLTCYGPADTDVVAMYAAQP